MSSPLYNIAWRFDKRQLIHEPCNLCQQDDTIVLLTDQNHFQVVKCRRCGFVYVDPRPREEYLREFYESYFVMEAEAVDSWRKEMLPVFREARDIVESECGGGRLLDIGCSFGFFIKLMAENSWHVFGVEPSRKAVEYARTKLRLGNITHGMLEDGCYPKGYFDAVTMFYVLEHVQDPRRVLAIVHDILKANGLLIIRVPHAEPFIPLARTLGKHDYFQAPMHLNDFSPKTMTEFLSQTGFRDVKVLIGKPRSCSALGEKVVAWLAASVAQLISKASQGALLFPYSGGKTYICRK